VPLAAAVAVIAVVAVSAAVVSGGSTRKASTGHGQRGRASAAASQAAVAQVARIHAGVIGLFMPATGAEYTTGALFHGQIDALESDATATCMARSGFQSGRITAAEAVAAFGYYDLSQFADLDMISRTGVLDRTYHFNPGPAHWSKAYTRAYGRCSNAATRPFAQLLRVGFQLGSPFPDTATTPAAVAARVPALRSCAARYG
jgi:hypothetical protein